MCLRCEDRPLTKLEREQAEIYKSMNWSLLYGARGIGKNYAAASKVRGEALHCRLINGKLTVGYLRDETATKLPPKICNYRKPKLYWYGELHRSNNFVHNPSMQRSSHWAVAGTRVGSFKGKRFIGISEPTEIEKMDSDFLKRLTGDDWVETRTSNVSSKSWVPQGKIFVMSGKPLKINDKSKETIERVQDITYP